MKETRFIAQNKEKWEESESLLGDSVKDPEKLTALFTQVVDDLSYSRTYYPNRSVRVYLNKIAREYFSQIYRHRRSRKGVLKQFWLDELPHIVYESRRALVMSFLIFSLSAAIGIFSARSDPGFASTILGERYVAMTKANIEKGDPMAVYKEGHQVDMFLGITLNNLMVAFRTYVFGVFLSIGTVAILLYNGVMVGCFQFFFVERGLFAESALAIWLHGTLEISSIILAGGAGLVLGSGLLFPGTYSRLQAFQLSAMRSLKLMLGIAPLFVLAGIIEAFLTRYTDVPDILRLLLILLSASFILGYFVYFPWIKSRRGFDQPLSEVKLPPDTETSLVFDRIKNNGEILKDTFAFYKKWSSKLFSRVALVTLFVAVVETLSTEPRAEPVFLDDVWAGLFGNLFYGLKTNSLLYLGLNALACTAILDRVFALAASGNGQPAKGIRRWGSRAQLLVVMALFFGVLYSLQAWGIVLVAGTFLLFLLLAFAGYAKGSLPASIDSAWRLSGERFGQVMGLQFVLLMTSVSFLMILSAPLLYMNIGILKWNFAESDTWAIEALNFLETYLKVFVFNLSLPVFGSGAASLYFSLREIHTAESLKASIQKMGASSQKVI